MTRTTIYTLTLTILAALPVLVAAQSSADQAADAALMVTARADEAFERIDPALDTLTQDETALTYADLPPLTAQSEVEPVVDVPATPETVRGPAIRTIASEVIQPLPTAVPSPIPAAISSNDPFVIKSILPIEGSIRYGDWFWDEGAAPKAGKLIITVDLDARVISAFRDGHEIGTAVALLGTRSHPTPLGTFPILTKEKDNVSEKYNNAPMPHTLRLTWDGIAIHGSPVLNGYASHGCVGVPDEFAAKLFSVAKRGDNVVITRGKMVGVGDKVL